MSLDGEERRPFALALWLATLIGVAFSLSAAVYICSQRILLTGKLVHFDVGRRLWQAIIPPQVFAALCIAVILWYEWTRSGEESSAHSSGELLNTQPHSVAACRAVFWLSHLTPSFYALPYIQRGLRMVVLFDTGLRRRFKVLTSSWYVI